MQNLAVYGNYVFFKNEHEHEVVQIFVTKSQSICAEMRMGRRDQLTDIGLKVHCHIQDAPDSEQLGYDNEPSDF
jgi:hypothetical protein